MRPRLLVLLLCAACRGRDGGSRIDNRPADTIRPGREGAAATCPGARDADEDGWDAVGDGGSDCDDFDPGVSPGAEDPVVDGLDADCDGVDGPPVEEPCVPTGPEDCDGVDDDCDGRIDDAYAVIVDGSPAVSAAAPLLAGGAMALVVGDTSGVATEDGAVALYDTDGALVVRIVGTGQSPSFGSQIATGRDLTGDGVVDLVVAAPYAAVDGVPNEGRVFVFPGPIGPDTTVDDAHVFDGGAYDGQPGASLAIAPDLTGDGRAELLVGYYRHVLLFSGVDGDVDAADADAVWERNTGGGNWTFATVPDADGDGRPELVLGMPTANGGAGFVGRWDSGRIGGSMGAEDHAWAPGDHTGLGGALARVGDALWALAGGTPVRLDGSGVAATLPYTATGLADGGDLDGDGAEDLLVATSSALIAIGGTTEIGRWGGAASVQSDRSLAAPTDVNDDGVPDPRVRADTWAAVLDGALAFGGSCDADGDGVGFAQGDCDDDDPAVAPLYGRDVCNGVDDDCDGVIDSPAELPLPRAVWVSGLGDTDGDGRAEAALLDGTGLVHVFGGDGATRATLTDGRPDVPYPHAGVGDTDGNAVVELLVSGEPAAWLVPPGVSGSAEALARTTFVDGTARYRDGRVGHGGDRDGDGLADVWIGTRTFDGALALAFFHGPAGDHVVIDDADLLLATPPSWDTYEVAAARPGERADLDGDGLDDLLVGNPRSAWGAGRAYVFFTVPPGAQDMDTVAALQLYGEPGEQMGATLAIGGDLDGDARDDALVGGATGVRPLAGASCPLLLAARWDVPAEGIALADLDGDGRAEAWLADDDHDGGRGAVWRVRWGDAPEPVRVGALGESLGGALWALGDTDGVAGTDLLWQGTTGGARVGQGCL